MSEFLANNKAVISAILALGAGIEKVGLIVLATGMLSIPIAKGKVAKKGIVIYLVGITIEIISIYWRG